MNPIFSNRFFGISEPNAIILVLDKLAGRPTDNQPYNEAINGVTKKTLLFFNVIRLKF